MAASIDDLIATVSAMSVTFSEVLAAINVQKSFIDNAAGSAAGSVTAAANSEDEADAPVKEAVEREVTNRIVASGHPPLNTAKAESEDETRNKLSRDAFNSLSPVEKNTFMRNGGKLTN